MQEHAAAGPAPTAEQAAPVAPAAEDSASTTLEKNSIWVGGLALALGGIFLVRYTIEQGLLGPGVPVFLGAIFSALLIAAGEWARRNEIAAGTDSELLGALYLSGHALLAAILAVFARNSRPLAYRAVVATVAVGLSLLYLGLEIRTPYHGAVLTRGVTTDAEQYTYSAVGLIFGVLLLMAGFMLRSQPARLASAAVTTLTIGKVFLVDIADLTGIFRALSFIGLGAVPVGIGWLYQRMLFPASGNGITSVAVGLRSGNG